MNTIEYYNISDGYGDNHRIEAMTFHYSSKEKAIEVAVDNYRPSFDLDYVYRNIRFDEVHKNYNSSFREFSEGSNLVGYYEILLGETQHKIKGSENDILEFSAELSILFTEAKRIYTPEVKVVGQPYQPAKNEIEKIKETGPFPLYQCKEYHPKKYFYNASEQMSSWSSPYRATLQKSIYISYNYLKIH
jgi:hypothetical protein